MSHAIIIKTFAYVGAVQMQLVASVFLLSCNEIIPTLFIILYTKSWLTTDHFSNNMQWDTADFAPVSPPGELDKTYASILAHSLHHLKTRHPQNRKYIAYCITVKGNRETAIDNVKRTFCEIWVMWFLRHASGDNQTNWQTDRQTDRHADRNTSLPTGGGGEVTMHQPKNYAAAVTYLQF